MSKIVTFGEIMLRLSPPGYYRINQTTSYEAVYGGGEANVAVSLANYGQDVSFVTKLPENPVAEAAIRALRAHGVNTGDIVMGGDRVGIYFAEKGASQRPSKVVYDRKNSSISTAKDSDFDWDKIFKDTEWFHFTGITPALGSNVAEICLKACKKAKSKNIMISCDLNFRKKLWTTKEANKTMSELMKYVDICIANEEDAEKVFGIKAENSKVTEGKLDRNGYKQVAEQLKNRFGFDKVAITLRESISASNNRWGAMLFSESVAYFSETYDMHIIDRVGGGDSFGAGLIYKLISGASDSEALRFAVAASCLKHTIEGDFNEVSVSEVEALVSGDTSGRVQR